MNDVLDLGRVRAAMHAATTANIVATARAYGGMLRDDQRSPTLAEYFADLDARCELVAFESEARTLNAIHDVLARGEANRIKLEQRIF